MQTSPRSASPAKRAALLLGGLLAVVLVITPGRLAGAADAPKGNAKSSVPVNQAWFGTWNNRKYNTSGQLICTVIGEQNGQWIAKFTGTALGKPISYTALMTPKQNGANTALSGTTKVDGFDYQWSALVSGKTLNGSYKASNGNNGEFKLQSK
jgi:hypothetical protein